MPRRCNDNLPEDDPPKKRNCVTSVMSSFDFKYGEVLKDVTGKQWKLGKAIGIGGFGEIYLASDNLTIDVTNNCNYVAKIETHKNGPLFVEMNCYLRIAKPAMIEEWKDRKGITALGMPHYVASGSHMHKGEKYRFLILPKFEEDLEKILDKKKMLGLKTVLTISQQIIDVLEYIHSKGYIHSDIKASNILLINEKTTKKFESSRRMSAKYSFSKPVRACRISKLTRTTRNLRPPSQIKYIDDIPDFDNIISDIYNTSFKSLECKKDQVYLLDYGLACKYLMSSGEHKPCCADERRAHAGTILFCSRDAHKGAPSRRSDLESLGYNIIYWLTGNLPWSNDDDPQIVAKLKQKAMANIEYFLKACFTEYPTFLEDYFKYLQNLQFQEEPDYNYCKKLFKQCIKANGYKDDARFDFDNLQNKRVIQYKVKKRVSENIKVRKLVHKISRPPLQSNIPVKPLLRKKIKNKKPLNGDKWFESLTDPEEILKQARERKNTENDSNFVSNIAELNIRTLNPTYAMIEVYNKCRERIEALPSCKGDSVGSYVTGYTHAMMSVLKNIRKRKEVESEDKAVNFCNTRSGKIIRRCISKQRKKFGSPAKAPPQPRTTKSTIALKKDGVLGRRAKSGVMRRSYSLRG